MKHSHPNNDITDDERLAARIALNIHERPPSYKHYDKAILDDYFAGRIPQKDENTFFEYLEAHPEAYRVWAERARTSTVKKRKPVLARINQSVFTFVRKITEFPTPRLAYAGATCAVLIFAVFISLNRGSSNTITDSIDTSYAQLQHIIPSESLSNLLMPWEINTSEQAFSPRMGNSARAIAFANGLSQGKNALANPLKTSKEDNALFNSRFKVDDHLLVYQELGRWNILVWAACDNPTKVPSDFWTKQIDTAQQLFSGLPDQDRAVFTHHLNTSIQRLSQISNAENKEGLTQKLKQELEQFRALFSPRETPKA